MEALQGVDGGSDAVLPPDRGLASSGSQARFFAPERMEKYRVTVRSVYRMQARVFARMGRKMYARGAVAFGELYVDADV